MPTTTSQPLLLPLPTSSAPTTSSPAPTTSPSPPTTTTPTDSPTPTTSTPHQTTASTTTPLTTTGTSSTPTTATSTSSASQVLTTSGGQPLTITSFVVPSTTSTPTPQNHSTTSNSFFSNKGAVAGVFTVVGLIVVALIVALIVNAIRRRRAQKFDRDVAEAAAEAAMSSRSPFDDYGYANNGSGGYGYSENSHGTYQQPPFPPHNNYGGSEMAQYDPYAATPPTIAAAAVGRARSRNESESGTPGIAGVGAGNLAREPSKRAPYHAFAGPGPQPHELRSNTMRSRRGDILEAAGLADTGAAAMGANNYNNEAFLARRPSEFTQNTHHSGRSQGNGPISNHPTILQPGYPVDSYYPQRNDAHSPESFSGYQPSQGALPNPHDAALPSPSLPGHHSGENEEYHESGSPTALRSEEQRMSYQDDTDFQQGNRVLRVANE